MEIFRFLLLPLSLFYGFVVKVRNNLFDWKVLPSEKFDLTVISVGNLVAGGSGKTPLVEYIIRLLGESSNIATLSRGYRRKTKGYRLAGQDESGETLGDEPMQYHTKFGNVHVAVSENRRKGIRRLMKSINALEAIILDDAFQHRYVKPGLSILVTDYYHTYRHDWLLPVGRLREHKSGSKRADIIVVTKTPRIFSPIVRKQMLTELNPLPAQLVCFSYINYLNLMPVYKSNDDLRSKTENIYSIILLTGIANPGPIEEYLKRLCSDLELMGFSDHHEFSEKELGLVRKKFEALPSKRKIIVTTEKDAMRLHNPGSESILGDLPIFYIPIAFEFHPVDKELFDTTVKAYVMGQKNQGTKGGN